MPMIEPASVICEAPARAMPKSVTFSRSSGPSEDVVRLDVAVDDPVAVREPQRREDLARVGDRLGGSEARPLVRISSLRLRPSTTSIAM